MADRTGQGERFVTSPAGQLPPRYLPEPITAVCAGGGELCRVAIRQRGVLTNCIAGDGGGRPWLRETPAVHEV